MHRPVCHAPRVAVSHGPVCRLADVSAREGVARVRVPPRTLPGAVL
ncbi:hypothetical protein [Streptomyces sp. 11-1-2]|nr:hypothetical protein [Streptomyces sp. 11-1-2]